MYLGTKATGTPVKNDVLPTVLQSPPKNLVSTARSVSTLYFIIPSSECSHSRLNLLHERQLNSQGAGADHFRLPLDPRLLEPRKALLILPSLKVLWECTTSGTHRHPPNHVHGRKRLPFHPPIQPLLSQNQETTRRRPLMVTD